MAVTISFALQKGGVGKTTSCALTASLLAEQGYRVLTIDLDMQANLTQIISGYDDLTVFEGTTLLDAMKDGDVDPYIREASDKIHYVPSDDYLALLDRYEGATNKSELLKKALESVQDDYDYILIDTPPALSLQTVNALMASNYVVIMFETAKMAYNAIPRFESTIEGVRAAGNPELEVIGILATLNDSRRLDSKHFLSELQEERGDLVFKTIIKRKATVGRVSAYGIFGNDEMKQASEQHREFVKELMERVGEKRGITQ